MNNKIRIVFCLLGMVLTGLQAALSMAHHLDEHFRLYLIIATSCYIILVLYSQTVHLVNCKKKEVEKTEAKKDTPLNQKNEPECPQDDTSGKTVGKTDKVRSSLQEKWTKAMANAYCDRWYEAFQCTSASTEENVSEDKQSQRKLCYEIALQTIDFLRMEHDRGRFTKVMGSNPLKLMEDPDAPVSLPFTTDPFQTPKEVRIIVQLLQADGIEEMPITIHGYEYVKKDKEQIQKK